MKGGEKLAGKGDGQTDYPGTPASLELGVPNMQHAQRATREAASSDIDGRV